MKPSHRSSSTMKTRSSSTVRGGVPTPIESNHPLLKLFHTSELNKTQDKTQSIFQIDFSEDHTIPQTKHAIRSKPTEDTSIENRNFTSLVMDPMSSPILFSMKHRSNTSEAILSRSFQDQPKNSFITPSTSFHGRSFSANEFKSPKMFQRNALFPEKRWPIVFQNRNHSHSHIRHASDTSIATSKGYFVGHSRRVTVELM